MQVSPVIRLSPVPVSRSCLSPTTIPASPLWILVRLSPVPVSRSCLSPTTIPASPLWILVRLSPVPVSRSCLSPTTIPASSLWIPVRLSPVPVSQSCLSPTTIPASALWIPVRLSPVPVSRSCLSPTTISASSFWISVHLDPVPDSQSHPILVNPLIPERIKTFYFYDLSGFVLQLGPTPSRYKFNPSYSNTNWIGKFEGFICSEKLLFRCWLSNYELIKLEYLEYLRGPWRFPSVIYSTWNVFYRVVSKYGSLAAGQSVST